MQNQNTVSKIVDSPETRKYSTQGLVAAMLLMLTWTGAGWNSLSTYSVFVVKDFGIATAQFMTNFVILSIVNTIISITIYGFCMNKFGTRKMIMFGGLMCSAGFAIFGIASNIYIMWAGAFVFACGLAFININTLNVMITAWFKKSTAKYTGLGQAFGPASGALFNTVWGIVMVLIGWRIPFFISAVFSLIMTFVIWSIYREPQDVGVKARGELQVEAEMKAERGADVETIEVGPTFAQAIRMPRTWLLFLGYALAGVCDYGLLGNYALICAGQGYGDQAGFIMGFCWLAQVFSFLILGWICDKFGSRYAVGLCFILVIFVAVVFMKGNVPIGMVYLCGAMLGFADGAVQMPMGASAREVLGTRDFAKKMGIVGGGCFLGVSFSTVIVAAMFDATGSYNSAFIMNCFRGEYFLITA